MRALRPVGTVLLALGFVLLALSILIRDPTALDANIGAGALALAGIPLGTVGLVIVLVGAVIERSRRPD